MEETKSYQSAILIEIMTNMAIIEKTYAIMYQSTVQ